MPEILEEGLTTSQIRRIVVIFVTALITLLIWVDIIQSPWQIWIVFLGQWIPGLIWEYWVLLFSGTVIGGILFGFIFYWDKCQLARNKQSWLRTYGDELGWPLMILAFSIQFLVPYLRPLILGIILVSSWALFIFGS